MYTAKEIKKFILGLDKKVCVQALDKNDHIRLLFTDLCDGVTNRNVLIYPLGEYPWASWKIETSNVWLAWGDSEIINSELTENLIGWLTNFLKSGVFKTIEQKTQPEKMSPELGDRVKNAIKGNIPQEFHNWYVICSNTYIAKYGDKFTIFATCNNTVFDSSYFLDIICNSDGDFLTLGSIKYSETTATADRLSLIKETDRLISIH